jgi:hypothetical protein
MVTSIASGKVSDGIDSHCTGAWMAPMVRRMLFSTPLMSKIWRHEMPIAMLPAIAGTKYSAR